MTLPEDVLSYFHNKSGTDRLLDIHKLRQIVKSLRMVHFIFYRKTSTSVNRGGGIGSSCNCFSVNKSKSESVEQEEIVAVDCKETSEEGKDTASGKKSESGGHDKQAAVKAGGDYTILCCK